MDKTDSDFWTTHQGGGEVTEREKDAASDPLSVERPLHSAISVLMAGAIAATPQQLGLSAMVVHAVAADGSSLCGRVSAAALLRSNDGLWSSVPGYERCLECSALI
jgi:hypothetical protein